MGRGAERKIVQNAIFHGKRHDNKILKVKMLSSRNFVVMAQAPSFAKKNKIAPQNWGLLGFFSQPQSITQKGVHARPLTAREREHWFVFQHLSHVPATNFGRQ